MPPIKSPTLFSKIQAAEHPVVTFVFITITNYFQLAWEFIDLAHSRIGAQKTLVKGGDLSVFSERDWLQFREITEHLPA